MNGPRAKQGDHSLFADVQDDAVMRALDAADLASTSMVPFGPMNDKWLRGFAQALAAEGLAVSRASAEQLRRYGLERVTHGRHCTCSGCQHEDWGAMRSPCGMHGSGCPATYDPYGRAGEIVPSGGASCV